MGMFSPQYEQLLHMISSSGARAELDAGRWRGSRHNSGHDDRSMGGADGWFCGWDRVCAWIPLYHGKLSISNTRD